MPDEIQVGRTPHVASNCVSRGNELPQLNGGLPLPGPQLAKHITINPLNHGFLVNVGCQTFAVENVDALLHRLNVYLKDPAESERKWMAGEWKW